MIVEINGVKLDVDERTAKTVDSYKVGDRVKVLIKNYSNTYTIFPGVIVGFAEFKNLPTVEIMYMDGNSYSSDSFKMVYINANTQEVEIAPNNDLENLLDKEDILRKFDTQIAQKQRELADMLIKRDYFEKRYAQAFCKQKVTQA